VAVAEVQIKPIAKMELSSERVQNPHDPEATYAVKGQGEKKKEHVGYKVQVAEFIEDWGTNITCLAAAPESGDPDAITAARAALAIRTLTVEASRKIEATAGQLSGSLSTLEKATASSAGNPLPAIIKFKCAPYQGLPDREFSARLSVLTSGDKPTLTLRIVNQELHSEQMAEQLAGLVRCAIGEDVPCLIGAYQSGA
jgi:uncharacterized protein YfdQ (DUF2303 family)